MIYTSESIYKLMTPPVIVDLPICIQCTDVHLNNIVKWEKWDVDFKAIVDRSQQDKLVSDLRIASHTRKGANVTATLNSMAINPRPVFRAVLILSTRNSVYTVKNFVLDYAEWALLRWLPGAFVFPRVIRMRLQAGHAFEEWKTKPSASHVLGGVPNA